MKDQNTASDGPDRANTTGESERQNKTEGGLSQDSGSIVDEILDTEYESVFRDKSILNPNTIVDRDRIYGREDQIRSVTLEFRDTLEGERPPDLILYGDSGSGKSLTVNFVAEKVKSKASDLDIVFDYVEVNFKHLDIGSLDRAVWHLGSQTAAAAGVDWDVAKSGISTDAKYMRLYEIIDNHFDSLILILDEIDNLTVTRDKNEPAYSRLLYSLSRAMYEGAVDTKLSTAAITNDVTFAEGIESRASSSYNPTSISFPDYNATELREILHLRKDAFHEGVLGEGVIQLAAAYGGNNQGDARKAIDLLRAAGEIANKQTASEVTEEHVRAANEDVKENQVLALVSKLTTQKRISLLSAAAVADVNDDEAPSPTVYEVYQEICDRADANEYTLETVNGHLKRMDTSGVLTGERTSEGYGSGIHMKYEFREEPEKVGRAISDDLRMDDAFPEAKEIAKRKLRNS